MGQLCCPYKYIMSIKYFFRYFCLIITLLICVFIYIMSGKVGETSNTISGYVIEFFANFFNSNFKNFSQNEQNIIVLSYQHFVRKAAHFSIYAALGFFAYGFINTYKSLRYFKSLIYSLIFVVTYAISDEIHQIFVINRSGQISDVFLDIFGGLFGILMMLLIFKAVIKALEARRSNEFKKQQ